MSKFDFANLKKHLEDDARRATLLGIEAKLVEHSFPRQIVIETTSYCNLKCVH